MVGLISSSSCALCQYRSQDLVVVGALEVWGMGRGLCPLPTEKGSGVCVPSPENFRFFGVKMTCFGAFWALL